MNRDIDLFVAQASDLLDILLETHYKEIQSGNLTTVATQTIICKIFDNFVKTPIFSIENTD